MSLPNICARLAALLVVLLPACADKAEPALRQCEQLKSEAKLQEALKACEQSVSIDPRSKAGTAAANIASTLKAEIGEAEAKRKNDQERQVVETRKKLLASGSPADLQRLLKEYAGPPEATEAEEELRKITSICANRSTWSLTRAIKRLGERPGQAAFMDGMSPTFAAASAQGTAERCETEAASLEKMASEIAAHALRPGEEPVRDALVQNHKVLAQQNRKWARAFRSYSGDLEPFAALQAATERVAEHVLAKDTEAFNKCLRLPAGATP